MILEFVRFLSNMLLEMFLRLLFFRFGTCAWSGTMEYFKRIVLYLIGTSSSLFCNDSWDGSWVHFHFF